MIIGYLDPWVLGPGLTKTFKIRKPQVTNRPQTVSPSISASVMLTYKPLRWLKRALHREGRSS